MLVGWNDGKTAYHCADGTEVRVKKQESVKFVRAKEDYNEEGDKILTKILLTVGPRNGVVHKFMNKEIKESREEPEEQAEEFEEEEFEEEQNEEISEEEQVESTIVGSDERIKPRVVVSGLMTDKDCREAMIADKVLKRATIPEGVKNILAECFSLSDV